MDRKSEGTIMEDDFIFNLNEVDPADLMIKRRSSTEYPMIKDKKRSQYYAMREIIDKQIKMIRKEK